MRGRYHFDREAATAARWAEHSTDIRRMKNIFFFLIKLN